MHDTHANADLYLHVRVIVGIILGLSIARLLNGVAGFVQHPKRQQTWWIHLGWVGWMLLSVIGFWWWEFRLADVPRWTFEAYVFVLLYGSVFFLLCTLLFPTDLHEYQGFQDYFMSRRGWFFGLLAVSFVMDVVDTWLKGAHHFEALGLEYPIRIACSLALCVAAIRIARPSFHAALVVGALLYQVSFLARFYGTLL
ncbi:hypothetical protein [Vineibacter terrae]|uniref:hypothetical protein n=1 Tax=Vineibacter terrae TaxID=2586908 RepID=UPI002E2EB602|nr:hypothetical protein [Vineibacter terrae]HEX2885815.1 hypothetical protein [Vineibacter terrae]